MWPGLEEVRNMTHQALTTYRALLDAAAAAHYAGHTEWAERPNVQGYERNPKWDHRPCEDGSPAFVTVPTGDRSTMRLANCRERLQAMADQVRKHWALYGGGPKPDEIKPKPRKASEWSARLVRCWLGQMEDGDHAGAMLTAEQLGGWYALVGNTPDSHARGFVAPQPVEGLPERIVSACRDDGRWVVMDRVSAVTLCNQKARSRASAEADALAEMQQVAQRRGMTPEALLSDALARVQPAADGVDQWRKRCNLVEVAPVSEVVQPLPEPAPEVHQAEPVQVQAQAPEPADLPALRAVVQHHADQYHEHGRAEIENAAFDALMARLRTAEVQAGQPIPPDSPTRTVGARPVSGLPKVAHLVRMLSLTSTAEPDGLAQWDAALRQELAELGHPQPGPVAYACEPKIDGVALVARYEAGRLVRLATRGNGKQGEDVTHAARLVVDMPDRLDTQHPPDVLDVVGEVFIHRTDWRALNDHRSLHGAQPYQDARGAVVAALQRRPGPADDAGPVRLRFAAHGVGLAEGWPGRPDTHSQTMDELQRMGLPVCPLRQVVHGPEGLQAYRARAAAWRDAAPFDTDGLVFKVDSRGLQARLGFDDRAPRWALADKSPIPATDYPIIQHGFSVALTQRFRPIQARPMRTRHADIRTRRAPMRTRGQPLQPVQARAPVPCPGPAGRPGGRAGGPAPRGQAPPLGDAASVAPSPGCRGQCGPSATLTRFLHPAIQEFTR